MGFERVLTVSGQQLTIKDSMFDKMVYYNGEPAAEFSGGMEKNAEFAATEDGEDVHYLVNLVYKPDFKRWFGAKNTCTVRRNGHVVDMIQF